MSSGNQWAYLALIAFGNILQFAVFVFGIVYALGKKRKHPRAANLVAIAMGILTFAQATGLVFNFTVPRIVEPEMIAVAVGTWNLVWTLLFLLSLGLLLQAVFIDRSPSGRSTINIDSSSIPLADRADDNPYAAP